MTWEVLGSPWSRTASVSVNSIGGTYLSMAAIGLLELDLPIKVDVLVDREGGRFAIAPTDLGTRTLCPKGKGGTMTIKGFPVGKYAVTFEGGMLVAECPDLRKGAP